MRGSRLIRCCHWDPLRGVERNRKEQGALIPPEREFFSYANNSTRLFLYFSGNSGFFLGVFCRAGGVKSDLYNAVVFGFAFFFNSLFFCTFSSRLKKGGG